MPTSYLSGKEIGTTLHHLHSSLLPTIMSEQESDLNRVPVPPPKSSSNILRNATKRHKSPDHRSSRSFNRRESAGHCTSHGEPSHQSLISSLQSDLAYIQTRTTDHKFDTRGDFNSTHLYNIEDRMQMSPAADHRIVIPLLAVSRRYLHLHKDISNKAELYLI